MNVGPPAGSSAGSSAGPPAGPERLYAGVICQGRALASLRAAATRPVHAYLLVGPPGTGKSAAAAGFAASLLCPAGGDGTCDVCQRVLAGTHPDVATVSREGPAITIDTARQVARLAARSPMEGARQVLVLEDFHLVREAGPALLKTIEEPPAPTIFVILAELVPPELVTIASRCVRVDFTPLSVEEVAACLVAEGTPPERAAALAEAAGARLDRARLLAADPGFEGRRLLWRSVPSRLDGSGATAAALADELLGGLDASAEPLRVRQEGELAVLQERNQRAAEVNGKVGRAGRAMLTAGVKELEERHKREARRQRTDELRGGLAALAGVYRERLAGPGREVAVPLLLLIDRLGRDLVYNPAELPALQALLVRLGRPGISARRG